MTVAQAKMALKHHLLTSRCVLDVLETPHRQCRQHLKPFSPGLVPFHQTAPSTQLLRSKIRTSLSLPTKVNHSLQTSRLVCLRAGARLLSHQLLQQAPHEARPVPPSPSFQPNFHTNHQNHPPVKQIHASGSISKHDRKAQNHEGKD